MNRILSTLLMLAGLFALTAVRPEAQTRQIIEQLNCAGTATRGQIYGLIAVSPAGTTPTAQIGPFRCIQFDPNSFQLDAAGAVLSVKTPAPIAGTTCAPPLSGSLDGAIVYAQATDKSCLPLIAVADPAVLNGFVGQFQYLFVKIPGGTVSPTPVQPPQ